MGEGVEFDSTELEASHTHILIEVTERIKKIYCIKYRVI